WTYSTPLATRNSDNFVRENPLFRLIGFCRTSTTTWTRCSWSCEKNESTSCPEYPVVRSFFLVAIVHLLCHGIKQARKDEESKQAGHLGQRQISFCQLHVPTW